MIIVVFLIVVWAVVGFCALVGLFQWRGFVRFLCFLTLVISGAWMFWLFH